MKTWKKALIGIWVALVVSLFLGWHLAAAADYTVQPSLSWDGNDATGMEEKSTPITIGLYETGTNALKSSIQVSGPVTAKAMPGFTVTVPDNKDTVLSYYAKATDSAGNASASSEPATVTVKGKDTVPPGTPVINITVE